MIERYGVYWVHLDPGTGSEMIKTRPAVVVSDQLMNRYLHTIVVCPITSQVHPSWPSRVQTSVTDKASEIAVDQIRTISKQRIGNRIGFIEEITAEQLRHVITQMYGVLSVSSDV
ncbi:MAG: type II toxin-antitoxin system PemK/MazF family toxin [Spirochaetia bacterium]|nr:type II toxin-antitoxin system PemK/MazF family toxin [Spirochaetia bacterium]